MKRSWFVLVGLKKDIILFEYFNSFFSWVSSQVMSSSEVEK